MSWNPFQRPQPSAMLLAHWSGPASTCTAGCGRVLLLQAAALEQEEDEGVQGGSSQDGGPKLLLFAHHR